MITIAARREVDDEYTPEQRRAINRHLRQGMKDIEQGRYRHYVPRSTMGPRIGQARVNRDWRYYFASLRTRITSST